MAIEPMRMAGIPINATVSFFMCGTPYQFDGVILYFSSAKLGIVGVKLGKADISVFAGR
jgi:hypothetical protein